MPEISIWVVLLGFSAMQGFYFAGLLLLQKQGAPRANRWLVLIVLMVAYYLSIETLIVSGMFVRWPHVAGTNWVFWYLLGPLLYFYVMLHLNSQFRFRVWHILHLLPAAYITVRMIPFYRLSGDIKISILQQPAIGTGSFPWQYLVLAALLLSYLGLSLQAANKESKKAEQKVNQHSLSSLKWAQALIATFTVYLIFDTIAGIALHYMKLDTKALSHTTTLVMSFFVHIVAFTSVRYPSKIFAEEKKQELQSEDLDSIIKYRNSALSEHELSFYLKELNFIMEKDQPYLNSDLKLSDLAEMINLTPHNLSQALNQGLGMSFYDYINNYRLKDVQKRLLDPRYDELTIFGIALESGFRSKTSFNRMFKKSTGLTPSSYIKRNTDNLHSRI
ncbi:MAG: helix-turn-helix domain-containing protein [Calditrichia bacterium]